MMNRQFKKHRKIKAQELFKKPAGKLIEIDLSDKNKPSWMTRAYSNNRYTVMINDFAKTTHGTAIRAMVQKHDDTPIARHWSEMQKIKNELFGEETTAIEYYPKESKLINNHNIYWMWIFPEGIIPLEL